MTTSENNSQDTLGQDSSINDQIIHNALKILESRLDELKGDVGISKTMLPLNIETDMTAALKKMISNPLSQLMPIKKDLDATIGSLINDLVKKYFSFHSDKVQKAIIINNGSNTHEIHYGITLTEDNYDNRGVVYKLLTDYKATALWENFPIYFQILPQDIEEKINEKVVIVQN